MKKVLLAFVVAVAFASCDDSSSTKTETNADSTKKDSTPVVAPVTTPDTSAVKAADSTAKMADTTNKMKK